MRKGQVDVQPLAKSPRHVSSRPMTSPFSIPTSAQVDMRPTGPDHQVEGSVSMRYDLADSRMDFTVVIEGNPTTHYRVVVCVPKSDPLHRPTAADVSDEMDFVGGTTMAFSSCHVAIPGVKFEFPAFQVPNEGTTIFSSQSRPSHSLDANPPSNPVSSFVCLKMETGARAKGVLCSVFTDDTGRGEVTRSTETLRLHGSPGSSVAGKWFGVAEAGSADLVALGRVVVMIS